EHRQAGVDDLVGAGVAAFLPAAVRLLMGDEQAGGPAIPVLVGDGGHAVEDRDALDGPQQVQVGHRGSPGFSRGAPMCLLSATKPRRMAGSISPCRAGAPARSRPTARPIRPTQVMAGDSGVPPTL